MTNVINNKSNEEIQKDNVKYLRPLFHMNRVSEWGNYVYKKKKLHNKSIHIIKKNGKQLSYLDSIKNVIKIVEDNNYPVEYLIQIQTDKAFIPAQNYNYISYGEAIKVFNLLDTTNNEVAKVFIVLQFFIYYINKKDKNRNEFYKFLLGVAFNHSYLVASCFLFFKKYLKKCEFNEFELFLGLIDNITLLELFFGVPINSKLGKLFQVNINLIMKKNDKSYSMYYLEAFLNYKCYPTHKLQFQFLNYLLIKFNLSIEFKESIESKKRINEDFKRNKILNNRISNNSSSSSGIKEIKSNIIIGKILEYVLKIDQFFKETLLKSRQFRTKKEKESSEHDSDGEYSDSSSDEETWKGKAENHKKVILSLALVSKRFYHITSQVLENSIDFSTFEANKILRSQINFGSPYCFFKKPLKSIRYDALIRTTPYNYIDEAFSAVESLVVVSDALFWGYGIDTEYEPDSSTYNISEVIFSTFPNSNSMPNLKKLSIVGRAIKRSNYKQNSGGLFLLKHFIANCGAKLEEFKLKGQLSLNCPKNFDVSLIKLLLDIHSSTLKFISIKFKNISKSSKSYIKRIFELLFPFKDRISIELYYNLNGKGSKIWKGLKDWFDGITMNSGENEDQKKHFITGGYKNSEDKVDSNEDDDSGNGELKPFSHNSDINFIFQDSDEELNPDEEFDFYEYQMKEIEHYFNSSDEDITKKKPKC